MLRPYTRFHFSYLPLYKHRRFFLSFDFILYCKLQITNLDCFATLAKTDGLDCFVASSSQRRRRFVFASLRSDPERYNDETTWIPACRVVAFLSEKRQGFGLRPRKDEFLTEIR